MAAPLHILRQADWLDGRRARAYRAILIGVTLLVALGWLLGAHGGQDAAGKAIGTDFVAFWAAGGLALHGAPAAAYHVPSISAAERAAFAFDPGVAPFYYPPPYLLLCLPLAMLPYFAALAAWLAATGVAYAAAVRRWLGDVPHPLLTILAYPAVMVCVGHGQNAFLTAALLGGGLLLVERRPWLAGLLLGSLVLKPQLAICLPIALAVRGEWRTFAATGLTGLAWCAAATLAFGAPIWQAFLTVGSVAARAQLDQGLVDPAKMVSVYGAIRMLGGSGALAYAAQACAGLAAVGSLILVARARAPAMAQNAVLAAGILLVSPYMFDYELTIAALPMAWLLTRGLEDGFRPWTRLILATGFALPLFGRGLAMGLHLPLAPPVLAALFWACCREAIGQANAIRSSPCRH